MIIYGSEQKIQKEKQIENIDEITQTKNEDIANMQDTDFYKHMYLDATSDGSIKQCIDFVKRFVGIYNNDSPFWLSKEDFLFFPKKNSMLSAFIVLYSNVIHWIFANDSEITDLDTLGKKLIANLKNTQLYKNQEYYDGILEVLNTLNISIPNYEFYTRYQCYNNNNQIDNIVQKVAYIRRVFLHLFTFLSTENKDAMLRLSKTIQDKRKQSRRLCFEIAKHLLDPNTPKKSLHLESKHIMQQLHTGHMFTLHIDEKTNDTHVKYIYKLFINNKEISTREIYSYAIKKPFDIKIHSQNSHHMIDLIGEDFQDRWDNYIESQLSFIALFKRSKYKEIDNILQTPIEICNKMHNGFFFCKNMKEMGIKDINEIKKLLEIQRIIQQYQNNNLYNFLYKNRKFVYKLLERIDRTNKMQYEYCYDYKNNKNNIRYIYTRKLFDDMFDATKAYKSMIDNKTLNPFEKMLPLEKILNIEMPYPLNTTNEFHSNIAYITSIIDSIARYLNTNYILTNKPLKNKFILYILTDITYINQLMCNETDDNKKQELETLYLKFIKEDMETYMSSDIYKNLQDQKKPYSYKQHLEYRLTKSNIDSKLKTFIKTASQEYNNGLKHLKATYKKESNNGVKDWIAIREKEYDDNRFLNKNAYDLITIYLSKICNYDTNKWKDFRCKISYVVDIYYLIGYPKQATKLLYLMECYNSAIDNNKVKNKGIIDIFIENINTWDKGFCINPLGKVDSSEQNYEYYLYNLFTVWNQDHKWSEYNVDNQTGSDYDMHDKYLTFLTKKYNNNKKLSNPLNILPENFLLTHLFISKNNNEGIIQSYMDNTKNIFGPDNKKLFNSLPNDYHQYIKGYRSDTVHYIMRDVIIKCILSPENIKSIISNIDKFLDSTHDALEEQLVNYLAHSRDSINHTYSLNDDDYYQNKNYYLKEFEKFLGCNKSFDLHKLLNMIFRNYDIDNKNFDNITTFIRYIIYERSGDLRSGILYVLEEYMQIVNVKKDTISNRYYNFILNVEELEIVNQHYLNNTQSYSDNTDGYSNNTQSHNTDKYSNNTQPHNTDGYSNNTQSHNTDEYNPSNPFSPNYDNSVSNDLQMQKKTPVIGKYVSIFSGSIVCGTGLKVYYDNQKKNQKIIENNKNKTKSSGDNNKTKSSDDKKTINA